MREYNIDSIDFIRSELELELRNYKGDEKLKFNFQNDTIDKIFFDYLISNVDNKKYKVFKISKEALMNVDLSNVSFDGFLARNFDFSGLYGVKLNPQTLKYKSLEGAKLDGVEFIGSFDGVNIYRTDFTGSFGAYINPQTVLNKSLTSSNFSDVIFIGRFGDSYIRCSKFKGSYNAIINPQLVRNKDLSYTTLENVLFTGNFDGVCIVGANFKGSFNASINLETIYNRDSSFCDLSDAALETELNEKSLNNIKCYKTKYNDEYISDILDSKRLLR